MRNQKKAGEESSRGEQSLASGAPDEGKERGKERGLVWAEETKKRERTDRTIEVCLRRGLAPDKFPTATASCFAAFFTTQQPPTTRTSQELVGRTQSSSSHSSFKPRSTRRAIRGLKGKVCYILQKLSERRI